MNNITEKFLTKFLDKLKVMQSQGGRAVAVDDIAYEKALDLIGALSERDFADKIQELRAKSENDNKFADTEFKIQEAINFGDHVLKMRDARELYKVANETELGDIVANIDDSIDNAMFGFKTDSLLDEERTVMPHFVKEKILS